MHLLYLDDSGCVGNPQDKHLVLAGLAVPERSPHWFTKELDQVAKRVSPEDTSIEFRGADIWGGKKGWRKIDRQVRNEAHRDALQVLGRSANARLFGVAIHKEGAAPEDPMEYAFEQICNRFDRFLARLHKNKDTQRGLIILDDSAYETALQGLATNFRAEGHRWGVLRNIADVPLFVSSKATRMIQYADLVAYSLRRYYEYGDAKMFDLIKHRFDAVGGVVHGLHHRVPSQDIGNCNCHSCRQRSSSGSRSPERSR